MPGGIDDISSIPAVHDQIAALHSRLRDDHAIRGYLDCYLLALYCNPIRPAAWMVLSYVDTFHYWNLPDLCPIVRNTLMGLCPCPHLQRLFNMFL